MAALDGKREYEKQNQPEITSILSIQKLRSSFHSQAKTKEKTEPGKKKPKGFEKFKCYLDGVILYASNYRRD